jgi:hypothetical protein
MDRAAVHRQRAGPEPGTKPSVPSAAASTTAGPLSIVTTTSASPASAAGVDPSTFSSSETRQPTLPQVNRLFALWWQPMR